MFPNLAVATAQPQVVVSCAGILLVYGVYKISAFIYDKVTSPIRDIPGPPNPSLIYGSFKELLASENSELLESWINEYGSTIQFKMMLGTSHLMTTDLKANNHILFHSYDYAKPDIVSRRQRELFGNGILFVEGDVHKHQRKLLNPIFGPQQIRQMTEIILEKSLELRDIWNTEIVQHGGVAPIDCHSWMNRTTLEIVGLGVLDYKFNALSGDPDKNELMNSLSTIVKIVSRPNIISILKATYPSLSFVPAPNDAERKEAINVMDRVGAQLLDQSKASQDNDTHSKSSRRKDLLSLMIQANATQGLPEAQQLKDEDMMAQIPTFILGGHETTSTAMTWGLYELTQNKEAQTKLRQEVSSVSTDTPTMDELNGLPYLDAVVREILRVHPSPPTTLRAAQKDDCIPLSKPFTDRNGIVRHEIRVKKGQWITVPIILINRDKSIWGEDAMEFKPERWANVPAASASIPGVWANIMTFLGGPRACIGYKFALLEMKALLYTLVRAFEFDLAVPGTDLKANNIHRPILLTDPKPLLVRPVSSNL